MHNALDTVIWNHPLALGRLSGLLKEQGLSKAFLVSDCHTAVLGREAILRELPESGIACACFCYGDESLVPDEYAVGRFLIACPHDVHVIIGLGAGTINDLCRYIAFRLGIPYVIIPTAASMDGYCSSVSPLIVNGVKMTYEAIAPMAVIGDVSLYRTAPPMMACAGLGDMLGKYTCLCDWRLGHIVNDEYFSDEIAGMASRALETCMEAFSVGDGIDDTMLEALMNGLCLSGMAMAHAGNSRPASGSEHHIAHFWEMYLLREKKPPVLHGIKVGFTTLLVMDMDQWLAHETVDWNAVMAHAEAFDAGHYRKQVLEAYGNQDVVDSDFFERNNSREALLHRLDRYRTQWSLIQQTIRQYVPGPGQAEAMLRQAGLPDNPQCLGIGRNVFVNSICYAKELRDRFTVLQIAADLGLLPSYAERLAQRFYDSPMESTLDR